MIHYVVCITVNIMNSIQSIGEVHYKEWIDCIKIYWPIKHFEVVNGFIILNWMDKNHSFSYQSNMQISKNICKLFPLIHSFEMLWNNSTCFYLFNAQIINWPSESFPLECWNQWLWVKWIPEIYVRIPHFHLSNEYLWAVSDIFL